MFAFQDFPKDTPKEMKDAMIAQRKPLVKDFFDSWKGKISIKGWIHYIVEFA